ncbi:hypothetical protein [Streptomyces sp. DSM 118878]
MRPTASSTCGCASAGSGTTRSARPPETSRICGSTTGESRQSGELRLTATRPGKVDGLLLWLDLQGRPGGKRLDTLSTRTNWLPVYVPLLADEQVSLDPGDVIELQVSCEPSADGVHPDYRFAGTVRHADGRRIPVTAESLYGGSTYRQTPLHKALFSAA